MASSVIDQLGLIATEQIRIAAHLGELGLRMERVTESMRRELAFRSNGPAVELSLAGNPDTESLPVKRAYRKRKGLVPCEWCGGKFVGQLGLGVHKIKCPKRPGGVAMPVVPKGVVYTCQHCGKRSANPQAHTAHVRFCLKNPQRVKTKARP